VDTKRKAVRNMFKMAGLFSAERFKKAWKKLVIEDDPALHKSGNSAFSLLLIAERVESKLDQLEVNFHSFFMPDLSNEDQTFLKRYFQHVTLLKDALGYVEFEREVDLERRPNDFNR